MAADTSKLKPLIAQLITLYKQEVAKNAGPDPAQADIDAMAAEITSIIPPSA